MVMDNLFLCVKDENELIIRIREEIKEFRHGIFMMARKDIYDMCNKIRVYECLYEYFDCCEELKPLHVRACLRERNILQSLYELYVKHEYLKVDTWEDIEALLDEFVRRQSGDAA